MCWAASGLPPKAAGSEQGAGAPLEDSSPASGGSQHNLLETTGSLPPLEALFLSGTSQRKARAMSLTPADGW